MFKKNISSCKAKWRRQRRRTVKNDNMSKKQKSNFARAVHFFGTFPCHCFAGSQYETYRNFLVTRFMEETSDLFLFTLFSLPLIFTWHWWPLAFLIFSPPLQNCHVVLPTKKMSPLLFISRSRSLSPFFSLSFAGMPPTFSSSIFQILGNHNSIKLSF